MFSSVASSNSFQLQRADQLISRVVEAGIAALFKRTERISVSLHAEPIGQLLQGRIDSTDLMGQGMLMYNGLRIETMELYLGSVWLDFSAIFSGRIKLHQPAIANMRVVLTEADLTASFNSAFIVERLERLKFEEQALRFQQIQLTITPQRLIRLQALVQLQPTAETVAVDFTADLVVEECHRLRFVDVVYAGNQRAIAVGEAIIQHINHLMDLDRFALDGSQLRIDRFRIQHQDQYRAIVFYGSAQIDRFPSLKRNPVVA